MTGTGEMIERVARALCDDTLKRWRSPIGVQSEPWREFIPAARAAIEAMREPTDEMKKKGQIEFLGYNSDFDPPSVPLVNAWDAMIDAALE